MHVRKKSQAFELTPGQTLLISILEKLNYLRGSIGLCENYRRPDRPQSGVILKDPLPFVACMVVAILILCLFPGIATWLPDAVMESRFG